VFHCQTFSAVIVIQVARHAQNSRTNALPVCLTCALILSYLHAPQYAKKESRFTISQRQFALTVIHLAQPVLEIQLPAHLASLGQSLTQIILADQAAYLTIRFLLLVFARLVNFHVLNARVI
jgi:hypothetical protein